MEFKEYSNPESKDYDIKSGINAKNSSSTPKVGDSSQCFMQLVDMVGILEDVEDNDLIQNYGISVQEYYNPTADTIRKVSEKLESVEKGRVR